MRTPSLCQKNTLGTETTQVHRIPLCIYVLRDDKSNENIKFDNNFIIISADVHGMAYPCIIIPKAVHIRGILIYTAGLSYFLTVRHPQWTMASSSLRFRDHTQTHNTRQDSPGQFDPSQRPVPDSTQHSQQTDIHALGGIRTYDPSKRASADPRLRRKPYMPVYLKGCFMASDIIKLMSDTCRAL